MIGESLHKRQGRPGGSLLQGDLDRIMAHTGDIWEDLRGRRLFITGGTGFFGSWLLESLAWANARLDLDVSALILTRDPAAFGSQAPHLACNPAFRFHTGDVRDFTFPAGEFSHIIHAAATPAKATFNKIGPQVTFDIVLEGTRRALAFASRCGARRFLLVSSGAVYGRQPAGMTHLSEDYIGAPDSSDAASFLGVSKRAAECLGALHAARQGFEVTIARCFSFVGPYLPLDVHYAVGNFIHDAMKGGPVVVRGDGTPLRSYLYTSDLTAWLWTILMKGRSCFPYNVGSEDDVTVEALARLVAGSMEQPVEVKILKKPDSAAPRDRYVPSTRRARTELGLAQTISLGDAIMKTVAYHRSRGGAPAGGPGERP